MTFALWSDPAANTTGCGRFPTITLWHTTGCGLWSAKPQDVVLVSRPEVWYNEVECGARALSRNQPTQKGERP